MEYSYLHTDLKKLILYFVDPTDIKNFYRINREHRIFCNSKFWMNKATIDIGIPNNSYVLAIWCIPDLLYGSLSEYQKYIRILAYFQKSIHDTRYFLSRYNCLRLAKKLDNLDIMKNFYNIEDASLQEFMGSLFDPNAPIKAVKRLIKNQKVEYDPEQYKLLMLYVKASKGEYDPEMHNLNNTQLENIIEIVMKYNQDHLLDKLFGTWNLTPKNPKIKIKRILPSYAQRAIAKYTLIREIKRGNLAQIQKFWDITLAIAPKTIMKCPDVEGTLWILSQFSIENPTTLLMVLNTSDFVNINTFPHIIRHYKLQLSEYLLSNKCLIFTLSALKILILTEILGPDILTVNFDFKSVVHPNVDTDPLTIEFIHNQLRTNLSKEWKEYLSLSEYA